MTATERSEISTTPESARLGAYLTDRPSYHGRSERIHGFNRIAEAIGRIPNIRTVEPVILLGSLYAEYAAHGLSPTVKDCAAETLARLQGDKYPLIVRRLFPDQNGDAKTGPRSGNVQSVADLTTEIENFYEFFTANYDASEVEPEIMAHRVVDAGNPPLIENPLLPYPAGDVTPVDHHTYLVRALFGADESVQGYPHDVWTVKYHPDGSVAISQPTRARKTLVKIPAPGDYREIEIPEEYQNTLPLSILQVLSLTEVAKNLFNASGPHRLEFDGTRIDGQEFLAIIEAAPFKIFRNSYEGLKLFGNKIIRPLTLVTSDGGIHALPSNDLAIVHLPPEMFQGNNLRVALTDLALTAKAKHIPLAVLVAGNVASQHAIRDIIDHGHAAWFTGSEQFKDGANIRLYTNPDGSYDWEDENPIVPQEEIRGKRVEQIGGKAIGLQKLEEHGFATSPYFVLETSLFRRIIEDLGLIEELTNLNQLSPTDRLEEIALYTNNIRDKIVHLSQNHIPSLDDALTKIGGDLFAVRSSAVLEDGQLEHGISLAGIYDTKLNVDRQGLREAILEVLASGVSPLAVKSALTVGVNPSEVAMAIIIQKMVKAQAAGTIFTKDHLRDDDTVIKIEATSGLGDEIVDGTAKALQITSVNKKTGEIIKKSFPDLRPVLDDNQIRQLARFGIAVEDSLNEGPQDIEWAINEVGEIIPTQARPL